MQAAADDDAGGAAVQAPAKSLGVTGSAIQAAGCTSTAGDLQICLRGTSDLQLQSCLLVMPVPLKSVQSASCMIPHTMLTGAIYILVQSVMQKLSACLHDMSQANTYAQAIVAAMIEAIAA